MAWYPGAKKYELQPESDAQPAIRPTQFIIHSVIAPWTAKRIYEYWRDSTNLESHFGVGYEGDTGQFIGTQTRADANADANRRADGTGAVSCETASNLQGSDPWTDAQVEALIQIGAWLHREHDIPLRICRSATDPGYGIHKMFAAWSTSGTACPGAARAKQFKETVFPGIVARAAGTTSAPTDVPDVPEDTMPAPSMLAASNPIDVSLTSGAWTGLAFTTAVVHAGPRRQHTLVHLLFDEDVDSATVIDARFYLTDTAGKNPSDYLATRVYGGGGHQFSSASDVPAGRHLRFEVCATSPDGTPVTLLHRAASGPYWAI